MNELKDQEIKGPVPISAEEFDRKIEAGEDVSEHFDWERAVVVNPGEMSPGQKLSIIEEMMNDLLSSMDARAFFSPVQVNLSVPFSPITLLELGQEAARRGKSREDLVRSWIEEKLIDKAAK